MFLAESCKFAECSWGEAVISFVQQQHAGICFTGCLAKGNYDTGPYLIFVIFFTQSKFLENKIYTEKRVNYDKLHSKLPILRVNYDKLQSKLPIFRVKSVKIYTGQFFLTQTPSVVSVTNMRYERCRSVSVGLKSRLRSRALIFGL